jgi:metal-responsive CopG/Arc/MetJ family transcriptional regulator
MKTAISIPDQVFEAAETLAHRLGVSRSELYAKAVEAFINEHRNQGVKESLNKVYSSESNSLDDEYYKLQQRSIGKEDW